MEQLNNQLNNHAELLRRKFQIILQGAPGTGKTREAMRIARYIVTGNETEPKIDDIKDQVELIQFHPAYAYEDFVRGIVATTNDDSSNAIRYEVQNKILADFACKAQKEYPKPYVLIIDEINRANLPAVLGELIYALEYRGKPVNSMYALEGNNREIILPENLYIIGTMNTADRSIGHIDYAIRRRFAFVSIPAKKEAINTEKGKQLFEKVNNIVINNLSLEFDASDIQIGHSYFIVKNESTSEEELKIKLEYEIKPILREYIKDGILKKEDIDEQLRSLDI